MKDPQDFTDLDQAYFEGKAEQHAKDAATIATLTAENKRLGEAEKLGRAINDAVACAKRIGRNYITLPVDGEIANLAARAAAESGEES
jgi:hypothetical protein